MGKLLVFPFETAQIECVYSLKFFLDDFPPLKRGWYACNAVRLGNKAPPSRRPANQEAGGFYGAMEGWRVGELVRQTLISNGSLHNLRRIKAHYMMR